MFPLSLLSTLLLPFAVSAIPVVVIEDSPISLPISRRVSLTSARSLYQTDLSRVSAHIYSESENTPVENRGVSYIASVGVGSPPTKYDLVVDTGSSNTWVGAGKHYVQTKTSEKTSNLVKVRYGTGSFSGTEFTDTVTFGRGLVIPRQSIGVASNATGFTSVDGILGIGPTNLTLGTLSPDKNSTIATLTDNLFSGQVIHSNLIAVSFEPTTKPSEMNGEITWGGTDSSKFTGSITYTPITSVSPTNRYFGIDQTITYGKSKIPILTEKAGIVDTGSTLMLISTDAFARYKNASGATLDPAVELLTLSAAKYSKLQSLFFTIGGKTFEFTANAQTWPRSLNTAIGGDAGRIYLIVADLGPGMPAGFDFINGLVWLERFYSVYDSGKQRVGFANTRFTRAMTN